MKSTREKKRLWNVKMNSFDVKLEWYYTPDIKFLQNNGLENDNVFA